MTSLAPETIARNDSGEHDLFSHYVRKTDQENAWITGNPCRALCGKIWVPTRDPEKYPTCPTCKDIYEGMFS